MDMWKALSGGPAAHPAATYNGEFKEEGCPWMLFTHGEEDGQWGAEGFIEDRHDLGLPRFKFAVQLDRKGSSDSVYYDCPNREFKEFIDS